MRTISETPHHWVIIEFIHEGEKVYKVFGGWIGGYLDGDRWKLNSGITKVESDEDNFYFYGMSGSCYKCNKEHYGIKEEDNVSHFTPYCSGILSNILKERDDIKLLPENSDWKTLNYLES